MGMGCKKWGIIAGLFALVALSATTARATPPPGYNLEWSDEFNEGYGNPPNPNYWTYDLGATGWGNNELETYTNDLEHAEIVSDENATDQSALQITATNNAGQYTSARLRSTGLVQPEYGYIEARIEMPYGDGIWPAFWTLGANYYNVGWPECGEQDIMENFGNSSWWNVNAGSLHAPNFNPTADYSLPAGDYFHTAYHKFAELWTPTSVTYYVDDIPYETNTTGTATDDGGTWEWNANPAFMLMNVAVGGNAVGDPDGSTIFPQTMLVDYIRVYTQPYDGSHYIPGVVQAEDFDNGGLAISYSTTTNTNASGAYRPELGVGIENTSGGGYDVNATAAGQWMKYSVNVQKQGTYTLGVRVASDQVGGGTFHIVDESNTNLTGEVTVPDTGGVQTWTTVNVPITETAGAHTLTLDEDSGGYSIDYMAFTSASGSFDGPHDLPGVVQNEDYDQGGEGVGFHSLTTTPNPANIFRHDPVTVENCAEGGYDVSSTAAGQWLKYTVDVQATGTYNIVFHVASGTVGGGSFHVLDENGNNLTGTVAVPDTGSVQNWTGIDAIVNLTAGVHTLQLVEDTGGYSLDYMSFSTDFNGPHAIPGSIGAADYDQGGAGIAYNMSAPLSPGTSDYRGTDAVGVEVSSLGGYDIGWTEADQWTNYTVYAQQSGQYTVTFTVASGANGGQLHLQDENGNNLTGSVTVPATGGWQTWTTVSANVTLSAGGHVIQLDQDTGGYNIAGMQFTLPTPTAVTSVGLSPTGVTGGQSSNATVTLTAAAVSSIGPNGTSVIDGLAVPIASSNADATIASGANIITYGGTTYLIVTAGQVSGTFTVDTVPTATPVNAEISATLGGSSQQAELQIAAGGGSAPNAPSGLQAAAGNEQVHLTWTADSGATSYNVYEGTSSGHESSTPVATGITSPTVTVTGLTNGTQYYFVVKAVNSFGVSGVSNEVSAIPVPPAPSAPTQLNATPGNASILLAWTASSGATSYDVYEGMSAGDENSTPIATGVTSAGYTVSGLVNGDTYYFVVKAVDLGGISTASNEVHATPVSGAPGAPTDLHATAGNTSVTLTWSASSGATSYNVYMGTSSGGESATPIAGETQTSASVNGLVNGTTYYFVVRAVNAGGVSGASNEASAKPLPPAPAAPTGLEATAGNGSVSLTWTAVSGATSYDVFMSTTSGGESNSPTVSETQTSATITGLRNGTKYYFTVKAVNLGGISAASAEASATPQSAGSVPSAPTNLSAVGENASIQLSWTAPTGATSYNVYEGTSAGGESATPVLTGITGTTCPVSPLFNGTTYYFIVKGVNSQGVGSPSNEASATPETSTVNSPSAPKNLVAEAGNAQVSLTWTASAGATSYDVYMGTKAGAESTTPVKAGVTAASAEVTGLTNGTQYYFVVEAVNAGGNSAPSNEANATPTAGAVPPPSAPTNLTATAGHAAVTLAWTGSVGATSYNVYRGVSAGAESATPIATGLTSTSYQATGLSNGTTYYFKVAAVSPAGVGAQSNEASATPEPTVTLPAGLQLASSPLDFGSTSLDTIFGITGTRIAEWVPTIYSYAVTPTAPANGIHLGVGFWVDLPHAVTLNGAGTQAPVNQNYSISLTQGWNSIGDPFFTSVPVSSLVVNNESFAEASSGASPVVSPTLWAYSASANSGHGAYVAATSLAPESGYWIYANVSTTLVVPAQ